MNKEKQKEIDSPKERIKKLETSKEEPLQVEIVQKKRGIGCLGAILVITVVIFILSPFM
tara:strand:- start:912 stop:1088 length:177 start_codon:yes stop_codon:yes gene_type:complete